MASTLAWQKATDHAALEAARRVENDMTSAGGPSAVDVQALIAFAKARAEAPSAAEAAAALAAADFYNTPAEPHYSAAGVTLFHGDCIEVMRRMPAESVDAIVTDPPYGIRFMGRSWDGADIVARTERGRETSPMPTGTGGPNGGYRSLASEAGRYDLSENAAFGEWCRTWAVEALRVLKPGGHILAFGGSRTWHRLQTGIEDAGFEIRDSIAWLYASGFPKSMNVSAAIDKIHGAEREVVGVGADFARDGSRRKTDGTHAKPHGTQGGHGHGDRWSAPVTAPATDDAKAWEGWGTALKPAFEPIVVGRKPLAGTVAANVLAHGTGALNIDSCRVQAGSDYTSHSITNPAGIGGVYDPNDDGRGEKFTPGEGGRWPSNVVLDGAIAEDLDEQSGMSKSRSGGVSTRALGVMNDDGWIARDVPRTGHDDIGGASRFFPVFRFEAKAPTSERPVVDGVAHPTVKPLALMRWLCRLVTPKGGTILEPFAGSGTTLEAAIAEGFDVIGIEREDTYLPLILQRIRKDHAVVLDLWGDEA